MLLETAEGCHAGRGALYAGVVDHNISKGLRRIDQLHQHEHLVRPADFAIVLKSLLHLQFKGSGQVSGVPATSPHTLKATML